MDIPAHLLSNIQQGRVILFLGAGASKGARSSKCESPPDGKQLAEMLSQNFLGGKYDTWDLDSVGELAASEAGSLFVVQDYIRDILEDFEPSEFHLALPTFRWRAIVTVNYDRIIEKAYSKQPKRLQDPVPFISNSDPVETLMSEKANPLPLIKIHGCVTRTHDKDLPLILTPEQYMKHQRGRERLYERVSSLAYEFTVVFIGHGLEDPDLRQLLLKLAELGEGRPRYYAVSPNIPEEVKNLWAKKDIIGLRGTFEEFLAAIDKAIPKNNRVLMAHSSVEHPIERKIKSHESISPACKNFLSNYVHYVHSDLPIEQKDPKSFYKGFDLDWFAIKNDLDVRRGLVDKLLLNVIIRDEDKRPTKVDFYVVKSAAGSGKSIVLRRVAWEAVAHADALVLYFKNYGVIDYEALKEIYRLTKERIFLFIDDAADHVILLEDLLTKAKRDQVPLTVITAERKNEWNVACERRLSGFVSEDFELNKFSEAELATLLERLDKHDSLGFLKDSTKEQQLDQLKNVLDRQILVMLHEVTSGKPFEEILVDEYNALTPKKAKDLYLSVCTLNQLGVMVRAGIISRLYSIPFHRFKEELFEPLEHVVNTKEHPVTGEILYSARHEEIAAIVFQRVLVDDGDRFDEYIKILRELDISYTSDRVAYRRMINHSSLKKLFPVYEDVLELFRVASEVAPEDVYRIHQEGIYEMERYNQNLDLAYKHLKIAKEKDNRNLAVIHSLAELARYRSLGAGELGDTFNRDRFRLEARTLADSLMMDRHQRRYGRQTLLKLLLDELTEVLKLVSPPEDEIKKIVQRFENQIQIGLQESPGDQHLLRIEADFRDLLEQEEKAVLALSKAHKSNRHNASIAIRLAKHYKARGDYSSALSILNDSLEGNPNDKQLHYAKAMAVKESGLASRETIVYHLFKSFITGDSNYDAQFWFARYLFESDDPERVVQSKKLFALLRDAPIPFARKSEIKDRILENGETKRFVGNLIRKPGNYGFLRVDGRGDDVFGHENNNEQWRNLTQGDKVNFGIGFTYKGPEAIDVFLE